MLTSTSTVLFQVTLLVAAFLCTLVTGELLVFQTVVMPGIAKLKDADYLRAFQLIDGIIQKNQPVFVFVWIGSVVALVGTCLFGILLRTERVVGSDASDEKDLGLGTTELIWLVISTVAWLICQYTTFTINVPMNNRIQTLDTDRLSGAEASIERQYFESPWMKWNLFRTIVMALVSVCLLVLLLVID